MTMGVCLHLQHTDHYSTRNRASRSHAYHPDGNCNPNNVLLPKVAFLSTSTQLRSHQCCSCSAWWLHFQSFLLSVCRFWLLENASNDTKLPTLDAVMMVKIKVFEVEGVFKCPVISDGVPCHCPLSQDFWTLEYICDNHGPVKTNDKAISVQLVDTRMLGNRKYLDKICRGRCRKIDP